MVKCYELRDVGCSVPSVALLDAATSSAFKLHAARGWKCCWKTLANPNLGQSQQDLIILQASLPKETWLGVGGPEAVCWGTDRQGHTSCALWEAEPLTCVGLRVWWVPWRPDRLTAARYHALGQAGWSHMAWTEAPVLVECTKGSWHRLVLAVWPTRGLRAAQLGENLPWGGEPIGLCLNHGGMQTPLTFLLLLAEASPWAGLPAKGSNFEQRGETEAAAQLPVLCQRPIRVGSVPVTQSHTLIPKVTPSPGIVCCISHGGEDERLPFFGAVTCSTPMVAGRDVGCSWCWADCSCPLHPCAAWKGSVTKALCGLHFSGQSIPSSVRPPVISPVSGLRGVFLPPLSP